MVLLRDTPTQGSKILLMGPSGSGKTCLATTLGARATVLDLNNGLASAKTLRDKWQESRLQCDVKVCWGPGGPSAMWNRVKGYVDTFVRAPERAALVIDSLSDLLECALGSTLDASGKWKDAKPATQAEWGVAIGLVERMLWDIRSSSRLVVVTAHTQWVEQDGVMREVLACFGKALPGKIQAAFDEVWYTKVTGSGASTKRTIQSQSTGGVHCKTRLQLPDGTSTDGGMEGLLSAIGWRWGEEEGKR